MPDDMLEDAINVSKTALDENDFESNGVEVSFKNPLNKLTSKNRIENKIID